MELPQTSSQYFLGVDPGSRNTGVALVNSKGELIQTFHFDPQETGFVKSVDEILAIAIPGSVLTIERYVAYAGTHNAASEQILMLIGAISYAFEKEYGVVHLVRAIDWKVALCKTLYKTQGFKNPSSSFDKKYSMAAATTLSGQIFKTDHEADAVCLAYVGKMRSP
jgi:Holliday junction resolvasome RuvABC endonuclease subunit